MKKLYPIILCLLVACGDDSDSNADDINSEDGMSTEVITSNGDYPASENDALAAIYGTDSKSWEMSQFTIQGMSGFQSCRLDDNVSFNSDGTYDYDGGEILCGAEDNQQTKSGTWELDFDNKKVVIDQGTDNEFSLDIENLTSGDITFSSEYFSLDVVGKLNRL